MTFPLSVYRASRNVKQWRAMYKRGWDAALIGGDKRQNPYRRRDFRSAWQYGYDKCMANEAPPAWFSEETQ